MDSKFSVEAVHYDAVHEIHGFYGVPVVQVGTLHVSQGKPTQLVYTNILFPCSGEIERNCVTLSAAYVFSLSLV